MIEAGDIVAILLAAGQSTRFGEDDKLLADLDGRPLILHAADYVMGVGAGRMIAVCGAQAGEIEALLSRLGFEIVINANAEQGLSTSLACGIEAAEQGGAAAAVICLGDMPFVSAGHLHALLAKFDPVRAPIVASRAAGAAMPPAILARSCFDELRRGRGDKGARVLLSSADYVEAAPEELADIDTIEDLRRLTP
jgi:molybdenum cofactor cytidylyltransferase